MQSSHKVRVGFRAIVAAIYFDPVEIDKRPEPARRGSKISAKNLYLEMTLMSDPAAVGRKLFSEIHRLETERLNASEFGLFGMNQTVCTDRRFHFSLTVDAQQPKYPPTKYT